MIAVDSVLPNGAKVLAVARVNDLECVLIAMWIKNHRAEYVVWHSDYEGHTYWGKYHFSYASAIQTFGQKLGIVLTENEVGV